MTEQERETAEYREDVTVRLTTIETLLKQLVGNGHEGIIGKHDRQISQIRAWMNRMCGGIAILAFLGGYFVSKIK